MENEVMSNNVDKLIEWAYKYQMDAPASFIENVFEFLKLHTNNENTHAAIELLSIEYKKFFDQAYGGKK